MEATDCEVGAVRASLDKFADELAATTSSISKSRIRDIPDIRGAEETVATLQDCVEKQLRIDFKTFCDNFDVQTKLIKLKKLDKNPHGPTRHRLTPLEQMNYIKARELQQKKQILEEQIRQQSQRVKELEEYLGPEYERMNQLMNLDVVKRLRTCLEPSPL